MSVTNLHPKPAWFHGRNIASFRLGQIPYFSVSQIAHELGISVVGDFDLAGDFLRYQPMVMYDRHFLDEETPEIYMPLTPIYAWLFDRNRDDMNETGREWLDDVWAQVQTIIGSSPALERLTMQLLADIEKQKDLD